MIFLLYEFSLVVICKLESTFLNLLISYSPKFHGYEELSFRTNSTMKYILDIQDESE